MANPTMHEFQNNSHHILVVYSLNAMVSQQLNYNVVWLLCIVLVFMFEKFIWTNEKYFI